MAMTTFTPLARRRAASALTAAVELVTWNGGSDVGEISVGRSSFEKPTIPNLPLGRSKTFDGDHSLGVFPFASTILAETYGKRGQTVDGLAVIEEALTVVEKTGERFYEAEVYRIKGELTLQQESQKSKDKSQKF